MHDAVLEACTSTVIAANMAEARSLAKRCKGICVYIDTYFVMCVVVCV